MEGTESSFFSVLRRTYRLWREDDAPRAAAALTYYVLLSVAPLLVILVGILGGYLGRSAIVTQVTAQATTFGGPFGARVVRELVASAAPRGSGTTLSAIAALIALAGAMQVFGELRATLNRMWEVPPDEPPTGTFRDKARWWLSREGRQKLAAFLVVLAIGVLLVMAIVASSAISFAARAIAPLLRLSPVALRLADGAASLVLLTAFFAVIYRVLPRKRIAWRDVALGSAATAALAVLGRVVLGLYFTYATPGSAYGAAGSLVAMLVWVNVSLQLLLFGAELTYVWAHLHGTRQAEPSRVHRGDETPQTPEGARRRPLGRTAAGPRAAAGTR